jgi:hypothetical protein
LDRGVGHAGNGRRSAADAGSESAEHGKASLADRIRALQSGASRAASN